MAFYGLGNDLSVMEGQGSITNEVELHESTFSTITKKVLTQMEVAMSKKRKKFALSLRVSCRPSLSRRKDRDLGCAGKIFVEGQNQSG